MKKHDRNTETAIRMKLNGDGACSDESVEFGEHFASCVEEGHVSVGGEDEVDIISSCGGGDVRQSRSLLNDKT
jgi:hypothetical protein